VTTPARIGVTGATGQVGSMLLRHLRAGGLNAVAVVRNPLSAALCDAAVPGCEIRVGSLIPEGGRPHVLDDCDVIINCALESSGGIPRHAYSRNRQLVDGLLKAKALKRLVHFSTVAVYGEIIKAYADADRERQRPRATSEYGRSKLYVERYAMRRARARGADCTIIRLGHVYGAGIARSREIVELARDPQFRLPFGGRLIANAIHADALGLAILGLMTSGARHDIYGLAEAQSTWRDVFDWHTACLGLPPALPMTDAESVEQQRMWTDRSVLREAAAWLRGLPVKSLARSPATFDLALRVLANTPDAITRQVTSINRRTGAGAHIARGSGGATPLPPVYLSAAMPGPLLDVPPAPRIGIGSEGARARELQDWYDLWHAPKLPASTAASSALLQRDDTDGGEARQPRHGGEQRSVPPV
jgi:nucleoside-diphosphate-sugar epimerase